MKVLVLYRPNSATAHEVESFVRDLQVQHGIGPHQLQVMDIDSRDGAALASLYDIMAQPSIVVTSDEGGYIKHWEGNPLPLMNEVAGYAFSA